MNDNNYTDFGTDNTENRIPSPEAPLSADAPVPAQSTENSFAPASPQPVILPGQSVQDTSGNVASADASAAVSVSSAYEPGNEKPYAAETDVHPESAASAEGTSSEGVMSESAPPVGAATVGAAPAGAPTENSVQEGAAATGEPSPYFYNYSAGSSAPQTPSASQNNMPQNPPEYPYTPQYGGPVAGGSTPSGGKKPSGSRGLKIFALVLAMVIVAVGCFSVGYFANNDSSAKTPASSTQSKTTSSGSTGSVSSFDIDVNNNKSNGNYTYEQVADMVLPSVVSITTYASDGSAGSYASGVIMTDDGYVLTNDHIYTDITAPKILVTLYDNTEYTAEFVAGDARSDLSIIKLQNAKGLKAATFGSSAALELGEEVMAIGSSDGLSGTVTTGVISSKERRISYTSENYSIKLIQMSAIINAGSSGGALVNMNGEVVGITSSKIVTSNVEGICFSIPSDYAVDIVKNMQQNGTVTGRAKLGITYTSIGTVSAEVNNLPKGVYIQSVSENGCLAGKDVKVGDIITKANGKDITCGDDLLDIIESAQAGDTIQLTLYRSDSGSTVSVTAVLDEYAGTTNYSTSSGSGSSANDSSSKEDFLLPNQDGSSSSSTRPSNPFSSR